jgi:hypothetical protein
LSNGDDTGGSVPRPLIYPMSCGAQIEAAVLHPNGFVSGHDFSRAVNALAMRALAPENVFQVSRLSTRRARLQPCHKNHLCLTASAAEVRFRKRKIRGFTRSRQINLQSTNPSLVTFHNSLDETNVSVTPRYPKTRIATHFIPLSAGSNHYGYPGKGDKEQGGG